MRLDDLNEQIKACTKCNIGKRGFQKTLGEGATCDVRIFFVCQKPHILRNIPLEVQKMLWEQHGSGGYFTYNLRFYKLLNEALLLGNQEETRRKLAELSKISLKEDPEKWWTIRGQVCRTLLEANGLYVTEAVKCPTNKKDWNRRPRMDEIRNCAQWLYSEIEILNPKVICTLGKDAAKALITPIELSWGKTYRIFGHTVFVSLFPGQYSRVSDEVRVKQFQKLKRLV